MLSIKMSYDDVNGTVIGYIVYSNTRIYASIGRIENVVDDCTNKIKELVNNNTFFYGL